MKMMEWRLSKTLRICWQRLTLKIRDPSFNFFFVSLTAHDAGKDKPDTKEPEPAPEVQTEVKSGDDETEDEELCSSMAVIEKIPATMSQEFLEMLVENALKGSDSDFTIDIIHSISSAVVTFQSGKGMNLGYAYAPVCLRF